MKDRTRDFYFGKYRALHLVLDYHIISRGDGVYFISDIGAMQDALMDAVDYIIDGDSDDVPSILQEVARSRGPQEAPEA